MYLIFVCAMCEKEATRVQEAKVSIGERSALATQERSQLPLVAVTGRGIDKFQ